MDIVSNILSIHRNGGKGNRKGYHASTIQLFEVLYNFGGSLAHNFINKILVGLALNTIRSNFFHKEDIGLMQGHASDGDNKVKIGN